MKDLKCAVTGKTTLRRGGLFRTELPVKGTTFEIRVSVETDGQSRPVSDEGLAKLLGDADFSEHKKATKGAS